MAAEDVSAEPPVRPAVAADADTVFELAAAMALTFVPDRGSFEVTYHAALEDPGAHLLVVDVDGRVAGYLLAFEHRAFFANGTVAWVEEIAIRDDLRRRGLGRLLLTTYEESVAGRGGRLVALATTRAAPFYEALGYAAHATYFRTLLGPAADAGAVSPPRSRR